MAKVFHFTTVTVYSQLFLNQSHIEINCSQPLSYTAFKVISIIASIGLTKIILYVDNLNHVASQTKARYSYLLKDISNHCCSPMHIIYQHRFSLHTVSSCQRYRYIHSNPPV